MRYRVKEIEAMQFTGDTAALVKWLGAGWHCHIYDGMSGIFVGPFKNISVMSGDYVHKMDAVPVVHRRQVFESTYEPVPKGGSDGNQE